jgi:carboxylesterase type B
MSGSSLVKAKPMALGERSFAAALALLSPEDVPSEPEAQVLRCLNASMEDVREKIARKVPMAPLVDGDLIPGATTYSALADQDEAVKLFPGLKWCRRVLVGDCQMDGSAYAPRVAARADILPKTLADHLTATLDPISPSLGPAIISGYGLDATATTNTPESLEAVLELATDICFALGARAFASTWGSGAGTESFLYRFNVPNPWDGPWKGRATHILDIAYVLQNYRERLAPGQQQTADRFTKDVVSFVNGGSPWPAYKDGAEGSMVYFATEQGNDDESRFVARETPETVDRRDIIQKAMTQDVFDKVMDAWEGFMKGPK